MKFKYLFPLLFVAAAIAGVWYFNTEQTEIPFHPLPSTGETIIKDGGEDGDNQQRRADWFELMHSTAPGTSWEALEYQTSMKRHIKRSEARFSASARNEEDLANGNLTGRWYERGSINQAGSVFVTEYDAAADSIYLVSAGGTLFKGKRDGEGWEVLNQDLRFENNFLKLINTDNGQRLLANVLDLPHYSDDGGFTWTPATGVPSDNTNGSSLYPVVLDDGSNHVYMLSKKSYWDDFQLFKSIDNGESYQAIVDFPSSDRGRYAMVKPHHSDDIYMVEKNNNSSMLLYKVNQAEEKLDLITQNNDIGFGNRGANLIATQMDSITRFVMFNGNNEVFQSEDFGATWILKGQMPTRPWSVNVYMSPSNPELLMYGDIECYSSLNGGATWNKVNDWGAYYSDVQGSLHADMMAFNEFETEDGVPFILISNHGGLSVTFNNFVTTINIGLEGLNVSQYYDVVTDPLNPDFIYAGSQDQGFQRAEVFDNAENANFDQVISGDYGHIVFSEYGQRLWTVYPGGWVTYYHRPQTTGYYASWEIKSDDETVWIPPMMPSPIEEENAVYLAGGNMYRTGGSYIIKLSYDAIAGVIDTAQIDYDFLDYSAGGTIAMMRTSPVNPDHWYVSTTNGRFFYSYDGGMTWDQSIQFVPGGHYLYGAAIYPSKLEENTVYFAGSGYSNPAVYKSTDGGQNFTAMNNGMPETLVFELTANEEETLFFAATEAGPYVYVVADDQWYDMSGEAAPNQTYWSVEFLSESQIIRFGTYGRGIWDFQIKNEVSTHQPIVRNEVLQVFPNPTNDLVSINLNQSQTDQISIEISDINGKRVLQRNFEVIQGQGFQDEISLGAYPKGTYLISLRDGKYLSTKQVVLQ